VKTLLAEIRQSPLLWLLAFVPAVLIFEKVKPQAHTALFVLSVLAIVPLAALLSHATESVVAKTGDAVGGLLNATLGNLTGSASQIALFVAPVLVLLSYVIGPAPMDLQFSPGTVVMMLLAALTISLVTNSGRSAWFVGVVLLIFYAEFAMTLYILPPRH